MVSLFARKKEVKKSYLHTLALSKVKKIERKNNKRFKPEYFYSLSRIFRIYIKRRFKLKKELTHEELVQAIKEKNIKRSLKTKIILFSLKISEVEYEDEKITKDLLLQLIPKLKEIIKES